VRIGLLGPIEESTPARRAAAAEALERGADFLLRQNATRIVYLGADDALDRVVMEWATRLVGGDPTDEAAWSRASALAISGTPRQIQDFVATERKRLSLRALVSLPEDTLRTLETLGGDTILLIHRRVDIEPGDLAEASVLVYGTGPTPDAERIGGRWFVTPGSIDEHGGVGLLDHDGQAIVFRAYDPSGHLSSETVLTPSSERTRAHS
jgi:hypothetical protein